MAHYSCKMQQVIVGTLQFFCLVDNLFFQLFFKGTLLLNILYNADNCFWVPLLVIDYLTINFCPLYRMVLLKYPCLIADFSSDQGLLVRFFAYG